MDRGRVFDSVADVYDAQRSGYPRALFADIVAAAQLRAGDRVLEVGCGSGHATVGFVAEGLDVLGVDPGLALIDLARRKFSGAAAARFVVAAFEEWPLEDRRFQLVAAAQSWHWVRGDIGYAKAAEALRPNGHLAIFGHTPAWSAELIDRLRPVYARLAPELWGPSPEAWYLPAGPIPELIAASGCFTLFQRRDYAWRRTYDARAFSAYLGTRSDHLGLSPARRDILLGSIGAALPEVVHTDWVTNLYVARVR
jgi:SAM-dependent methyltransferase